MALCTTRKLCSMCPATESALRIAAILNMIREDAISTVRFGSRLEPVRVDRLWVSRKEEPSIFLLFFADELRFT